jgi:hypothetical protein
MFVAALGVGLAGLLTAGRSRALAQQGPPFPLPPLPASSTPAVAPAPAPPTPPGGGSLPGAVDDPDFPELDRELQVRAPGAPGAPPALGRPRPGSIFDPGAAGPGISQRPDEPFLDGALDPRTGWPLVFLDHFQPRHDRVERFWVVETRDCPQVMGTDPWACLKVRHFNAHGVLEERDPRELLAQTAGRVTLVQVQGSLTTPDIALGGLMWTHTWLRRNRALTDDAVIVAFDWPSQRVYKADSRDINEKGRRAYVAGYHLARFLQAFPAESRVCLLGQSYGGRVVPSALHLLGGGCLNSQDHDPPVRLPGTRPDLHVRAVVIAGASDRDWLDPGNRLDRALIACEALLNLYNRRDEALRLYPFLVRSGHKRALGKVGLTNKDLESLGPLAARYHEFDIHDELGVEHSLLDAVADPDIALMIAPYLWNYSGERGPAQSTTRELDRGPSGGPVRSFFDRFVY